MPTPPRMALFFWVFVFDPGPVVPARYAPATVYPLELVFGERDALFVCKRQQLFAAHACADLFLKFQAQILKLHGYHLFSHIAYNI